MRTHSWLDVWNLLLEVISHESIPVQIFSGLAVALIAVMALEGLRASFFPKRIAEGIALRRPAPLPPDERPFAIAEGAATVAAAMEYVAPPAEYATQPTFAAVSASEMRRRSSPQPLRVLRKPI